MNEISPWRIRPITPKEYVKPEYGHVSEPDEVSLSAYWNILVKNRRTILTIFLLIFAAGTYFALSATTLYTAAATIKIEPQSPRVTGGIGEFQPVDPGREEYDYYPTQFALLQSRPLAARVIMELGLGSNKAFTDAEIVSPNPVSHVQAWVSRVLSGFTSYLVPLIRSRGKSDDAQALNSLANTGKGVLELTVEPRLIDQYLSFISIAPVKKTRLARIEFTTPNPTLSQVLANAHIQSFMRMSLENRFGLTQEAREFLDQKKNELRQKLEKSEAELNKFRREHNVLSVDKGENIVVDRLVDVNKQLTVARAQRIEAESLNRTVENRNYQDLAEIMRQGLVQQLNGNVANLEAEKARLATIFKPDHPRMQELNQQIASARQAFTNEIANVVKGIKSNYAAALAKERALESEAAKQQQDALNLRELGVEYTVLQEEVTANRSLYESVLKRLSETSVSNDLAISNMQIVERAAKPLHPSGPNVSLYLLASMASGIFFGVGLAFLREFVHSTVGTPDDVWRSIGVGTLGVVPHLKFLGEQAHVNRRKLVGNGARRILPINSVAPGKELIINQSPLSVLTESFRTIRTSLLLAQAEKPPQVILLTSPSPMEGKTTTSLNLAIALAQDGRSVLMVDGDMRKGACHDRLGLRNHRGLSNVLSGSLSLEEGVQQTPVEGLSLLSRGITPPNPSELLGSRKMTEIMKELRQRFEFILIDSPPVIGISDATILSVITDGVLLVINAEKTSTTYAQKAVQRLDMVHARLLGVVLNAVNLDDPNYSYYRSYSTYYEFPNENENGSTSEAQQRASENGEDRLVRLSTSLQSDEGRRPVEGFHESDPKPVQNSSQVLNIEDNGQVSSMPERDISKKTNFELHGIGRRAEKRGTTRTQSAGVVPRWFMDRLIDIFTDSMGPIAPLVVRDRITELGESPSAFPHCRMMELVQLIAPEIWHEDLRSKFQNKIIEEIRTLENT